MSVGGRRSAPTRAPGDWGNEQRQRRQQQQQRLQPPNSPAMNEDAAVRTVTNLLKLLQE